MAQLAHASRRCPTLPTAACLLLLAGSLLLLPACKASRPSSAEDQLAAAAKKMAIGGKDWQNPTPDTPATIQTGMEHFQHHCQICHGMDGHNTGVPFATKMSPPVADLGDSEVQKYADGQLKWIIENGIRFSGMPGWKGILDDDEMWSMVRFLRHLPLQGSQGIPSIYKETEEEHEQMHGSGQGAADHHHHHH